MYLGFPVKLVAALRCSLDNAPLIYGGAELHLKDATLQCSVCQGTYEVRDGIVLFLEHQKLAQHVVQEMDARDADASTYDAHLSERYYREIQPTLSAIGALDNKLVIEHGAGTGRFTEILSKRSGLYLASDISVQSLYVLARKNIPDTVGLVCADATAFPTAASYFDVALALQVIEHMPTRAIRDRFYKSVATTLRNGGMFVASVYHQDLRRVLQREPADGTHPSGVPFHFFSVSEFRSELNNSFARVRARRIDITLPLERRLHLSDKAEGVISHALEYVPLLNRYAHLVLAKAEGRGLAT